MKKSTLILLTLLFLSNFMSAAFRLHAVTSDTACTATMTITASGSLTLCPGGSVTLYASGCVSYNWFGGGAFSNADSLMVSPSSTTAYIVNGTDSNGCTASDTVIVRVDNFNINTTVSSNIICAGIADTLNATTQGGTGPFNFLWTPDSWLSCTNCQNPVATPGSTTTYSVTVTDASGCSNSAAITVNVDYINAYISFSGNSFTARSLYATLSQTSLCPGTNLPLYGEVIGGVYPYIYSWSPGNGNSDSINITLTQQPVSYSLTVTDTLGCSATASTVVTPDNLSIYVSPTTAFCNGSQATITITAHPVRSALAVQSDGFNNIYASVGGGNAPYTFIWNTPSGSVDTTYQSWFSGDQNGLPAGTYTVTVSDASGCSQTAVTNVIYDHAKIKITTSVNEMFTGQNDTLTASGGVWYWWNVQTANIWGFTTAAQNIHNQIEISTTSTNESFFVVWGIDSNGCQGMAQYASTPAKLNIALPANSVICGQGTDGDNISGLMAMVSGGVPSYTFVWTTPSGSTDTTLIPILQNVTNGTYTVTVTDNNGNKAFATGNVTLKPAPTNQWQPGPDTTIAHPAGLPPIYYAGNVSVGRVDSNKGILIDGNTSSITSPTKNINFKDTITAGTIHVGYFKADSMQTSIINLKDSLLTIGDPWTMNFHTMPNIPATCIFCPLTNTISYPGITWGNSTSFCNFRLGVGTNSPDAGLTVSSCSTSNQFSVINPTSDTDVFTIDQSGNTFVLGKVAVGRGITTPGNYGLYVGNGGILTTLVKIALTTDTSWADYVFAKNYKLKPIEELQKYILENKHLPDVPSAQEVLKDGVDVAKMDATLLKKIEELTLYMLRQQKQADEQQNEIKELKAKLEALESNQK